MVAVDTNILVYSVREDSPWHKEALACVRGLAEGGDNWAIPWPCVGEFLAIVTHPRIYAPPMTAADAVQQVKYWMESPTLRVLGATATTWAHLRGLVLEGKVAGGMVHDAQVAAICMSNGVRELWSADRDFSRFAGLRVRNPLVKGRR